MKNCLHFSRNRRNLDQSHIYTMMKLGNPLHQVTLFMDIEFYQQNQQFIKTYEIVTQFIRILLKPMDKGIFKRVKGTPYNQKKPR